MKRKARADSSAGERNRGVRDSSHHHVHHNGPYLDIDGDFDIVYGDGTPASLVDALAEPPADSWRPEHSPWDAVRASWQSMWQQGRTSPGAAGRSQTADEERT
jgi:hypothetical protein